MFYRLLITALLVCSLFFDVYSLENSAPVNESSFIGHWQGGLDETWYSNGLQLIFHIKKTDDGYESYIDSVDQETYIVTAQTVIKGNKIVITAPIVDGLYEAILEGGTLKGVWSQFDEKTELRLKKIAQVSLETTVLNKQSSDHSKEVHFIGDWSGTLGATLNNDGLRTILHIKKTDEGLVSTLDSLDQGSVIPTTETIINGNDLVILVPIINGIYQATLEGDTLKGDWTQHGIKSEFNLKKIER